MNQRIMNQVSIFDKPATEPLTMTSREIADFVGKDISHIHRDIRVMLDELKKDDPNLNHPQEDKDSRGYTTCFYLNRELTDTLLTGYSASARLKVIRRWHELEAKAAAPALPDFTNPAAAARAWADAVELAQAKVIEVAQQEARLSIAMPKADALDRISTLSKGSMCITNAAKALQVQPQQLFAWLQEKKWVYRRAGGSGYVGYQGRIQAGHLEHKVTPVERTDGSVRYSEQVLLTAKGLTKLAVDFGRII